LAIIELKDPYSEKQVTLTIEGISQDVYKNIRKKIRENIDMLGKTNGLTESYLSALQQCPQANPSDLWLYVMHLEYVSSIGNEQSWKRTSGFAFERVLQKHYDKILKKYGYDFKVNTKDEQLELLEQFGLSPSDIPLAKLDMAIKDIKTSKIVCATHVKVSIAERISDDAPASRKLMQVGCPSIIITLDMKHYPPPHGDGINYGELGGRLAAKGLTKEYQQKRGYIEDSGDFDALFSYNLRTPPSKGKTKSGKRIYTLSFSESQPDSFVKWISSLPKH
jgi:hypothetical protein